MKRFLVIVVWISVVFLVLVLVLALAAWFSVGFFLSPQSSLHKASAIVAISGGDTEARAGEAIRLYQQGWADYIVFSGAAIDITGPSNASAMREQARAAGVPDDAILLDESALNTRQNAAGVASMASDKHFTSIILVTSPYHQRRADITFRQALGTNVTILNHSAPDQTWRRSNWWQTAYSRSLTWSELRKTLFVVVAGPRL